ncbi:MAG TPA: DEAD/DEAH box helicase family protein, partial [Candidatus Thalassarchaeaceae archaeon]|nr:DEAD/DEAH box helicase family protein [Candidatus Thalassarchaeaceae archaeon]
FGQVIVPTGGGKTLVMIKDAERRLTAATTPKTIVVVAPRILLANQLCDEFWNALNGTVNAEMFHVHSGETSFASSTKVQQIQCHHGVCKAAGLHEIIFTTYNSLRRIVESDIDIDCIYYDEAHNAVRRDFFESVLNVDAKSYYFFTATPKHTRNAYGRGMNNNMVYGPVLENVPAPELLNNGSILAPEVISYEVDFERVKGQFSHESDKDTLTALIEDIDADGNKILIAAPSSRVMFNLLSKTTVFDFFHEKGYDVLHITSKYGAYVNKTKVNREQFFDTFNAWGKDPNRKFVIFHYSILSEGINVHGLTHCVFLRQLDVIQMAQTVGRVIRLNKDDAADIACGKIIPGKFAMYRKSCGKVIVPVFKNYGAHTIKRLQNLVETIFVKGLPAISVTV